MAAQFTEEYFSDDDLDALPANALNELEQRAFHSTQQKITTDLLHDTLQHTSQSAPGRGFQQHVNVQQTAGRTADFESPSSDYGFDDEDVIDLDNQAVVYDQVHAGSRDDGNAGYGESAASPLRRLVDGQQNKALAPSYQLVNRPANNSKVSKSQDDHGDGHPNRFRAHENSYESLQETGGQQADVSNLQNRIHEVYAPMTARFHTSLPDAASLNVN